MQWNNKWTYYFTIKRTTAIANRSRIRECSQFWCKFLIVCINNPGQIQSAYRISTVELYTYTSGHVNEIT